MRYLYHATDYNNLCSIISDGIKKSYDGVIYTTEKPEQAVTFLAIRGIKRILVLKIKICAKDERNIMETFDHNFNFFKFRCYGYIEDIKTSQIAEYIDYQL